MKYSIFYIVYFITNLVFCQDSSLDLTYGTNGKFLVCGNGSNFANYSAIQNDSKVLVFGSQNANIQPGLHLLKLQSNGLIDNSFGNNGIINSQLAQILVENKVYSPSGLAVLPNNKFYLLVSSFSSSSNNYIIKLSENGLPDNTFNGNSVINFGIGTGLYNDLANTIQLQPDGKILVGGTSEAPVGMFYTLVRLNSEGTFDSTFGTNGKVHTQLFTGLSGIQSIVVLPSGKILTGGYCNDGLTRRYVLVQYTANGTLDSSFGTNGITVIPAIQSFRWDELKKIIVKPDGKILVGGLTNSLNQPNAVYGIGLTQYLANGTLDSSFGINGKVIIPNRNIGDIAFQIDGKILVACAVNGFELIRLLENGDFDSNFFNGGTVSEFSNYINNNAYGVLVQSDNKIVVTGNIGISNTPSTLDYCVAAMRLTPGVLNNQDFTIINDIVVYPNPNNGSFIVNSENLKGETFKVAVYTILGQKVQELNDAILVNKTINLIGLPTGTYFLKFSNETYSFQKTIIIKQ